MTEVTYNNKDRSYECAIRIFTDDLEREIGMIRNETFSFDDLTVESKNGFLQLYVDQKLQLFTKDSKMSLKVLGSENEELATWIYASAPSKKKLYKVKNNILCSLYDDQTNILHIKENGTKTVHFFKVDKTEIELE